MRFIKAFPDGSGNCCDNTVRDEPCDSCARCGDSIIPDFDISAVPVPGAYSLWTLSATNTTMNTTGDPLTWSWIVLVTIDYVTHYLFKSTLEDLPAQEISAICGDDIIYQIFLQAHHPSGITCIKVNTFTATAFDRTAYPSVSSPDLAAVFNSYDDEGAGAVNTADWNGTQYESDRGFDEAWRVFQVCQPPALCGVANCDGILRDCHAEAFPRVSGASRRITYGLKIPHDISPFGTYELIDVAYPAFTPDPPTEIVVSP